MLYSIVYMVKESFTREIFTKFCLAGFSDKTHVR